MFDLDCYLLSTDSAEVYNHYKSKAERYFEKATALEDRIREILSEWKKDRFKKNGELTFFDTIRNEGI
jgi:hypothetical protein